MRYIVSLSELRFNFLVLDIFDKVLSFNVLSKLGSLGDSPEEKHKHIENILAALREYWRTFYSAVGVYSFFLLMILMI